MATNAIRVEIVWTLANLPWAVNVLHYIPETGDAVTQTTADDVGNSIEAGWTSSNLDDAYNNQVRCNTINVRDLRSDGLPVFTTAATMIGTATTSLLPAQTCVVTTIRSALNTRRGRGRIYWPAPAVGAPSSTGQLTTGSQGLYQAWMNAIDVLAINDPGNLTLGVYSRTDGVTRPVVSFDTNLIFDVQVRRRDSSIS